jgi:general secretion pathway protein L
MLQETLSRLVEFCTALPTLWLRELKSMWRSLARPWLEGGSPFVDLDIHKDSPLRLAREPLLPETTPGILSLFKMRRKPLLRLRLAPGLFLRRQITLPTAASKQISHILLLDLERATPFTSEDVFHGWTCRNSDDGAQVLVDHIIVRRDLLTPWLDFLFSNRILFSSEVAIQADEPLSVELLRDVIAQHPPFRRLRRIRLAAFCTLLAAAVFSLTVAHLRQSVALNQLTNELDSMKGKATEIRTRLSQLENMAQQAAMLRDRRRDLPSAIMLWEELTDLLPDSAWLSELRVQKGEVSISGSAQSSAAILELMEASSTFEKAAFVNSTTQPSHDGLERFTIRAALTMPSQAQRTSSLLKTP